MYFFGKKSQDNLDTCDPEIILLCEEVIEIIDISILCGHRNEQDQTIAFNEKRSKVVWPNSNHNVIPSDAVDVAPYPINWGESGTSRERMIALHRFYHMWGLFQAIAYDKNIKIRWGGDWDRDNDFFDQKFNDLVHIEKI